MRRLLWQSHSLDQEARRTCDVLFIPGGLYLGRFRPFVTMSRNLLPFAPEERRRFGWTSTRLRYHFLEQAQAYTFRKSEGVIFLTDAARGAVLRQTPALPKQKTAVVHHGVSDLFTKAPRSARPLAICTHEQPFRWLYVSIVNHYKHQWHVAEAAAQLRAKGLPVQLDLVGPAYPPALRHLQEVLNQLDPESRFIKYHGAVPYEQLRIYYQKADAFVFASTCETFGQILVEAMQSGLPIACSRRSAMPELLLNAGLYFDPEVPVEMANVMQRMMEDVTLRGQLAEAAYRRAQTFSWERCARQTFNFIIQQVTQAY